ncbi:MAG: ABC transporter permease [Planctomycetota bacterium]
MTIRSHILWTFVRKDLARLLRNGPALMMLGLLVLVAFVTASSGLVEEEQPNVATPKAQAVPWVVFWQENEWMQTLERRANNRMALRFVSAEELEGEALPTDVPVIEVRRPVYDPERRAIRHHISYRYPGSDPNVLWPATRWFLSASAAYFGEMPQFFETIEPLIAPTRSQSRQAALENLSVADVLSTPLIGTALLMMIQFFGACGLFTSMTAQERERGTMRALLLTPASYIEFILSKAIVHGGLAIGFSAVAIAALQPEALATPLFWGTTVVMTCGYLAVGILITSFAKNQAAPNLLSFAYLLAIGALNLMAYRLEAFQFLSSLTFERYGLMFTMASLDPTQSEAAADPSVLLSRNFSMFTLISVGLLFIATHVGQRRMLRG